MARKPPGPPPAPVVQKIRICYAKQGRMRFSSHRDFQRMLERALRRINAPMAYSAGFTPHPKISFAGAAPTGAASLAEYVELGLAAAVDPDELARGLSASLPDGLSIVKAVEAAPGKLADRLTGSVWALELPGLDTDDAERAASSLMAKESATVSRMTKKGERLIDVRAALVALTGGISDEYRSLHEPDASCAIMTMVVRHTTPVARPDDVLSAMTPESTIAPGQRLVATRLAQGFLDANDATVTDPLLAC